MKGLIIMLGLLLAAPAGAETLPVKIADGASWTLVARHDREAVGAGNNFSVVITKRLTFRRTDQEHGRLRVEHLAVEAVSGMPPDVAFTQTLDIPVEFNVDPTLSPIKVANLEAVRAATRSMILKSGGTPEQIDDMLKKSPGLLDDTAMALVATEISMASRVQGLTLSEGAPLRATDMTQNPMGGPPIRTDVVISLDKIDRTAARAFIVFTAKLDPKSMHDSMMVAFKRLSKSPDAAAQAAADQTHVNNETTCRNEIDIATGLALKVQCETRTTVTNGATERGVIDRWTITQTSPGTS
jgi:hypothetical protein